jgi:hypothetical protein
MAPPSGRVAAVLSLCLWIAVIVMGRMIGFTVTQKATEAPPPAGVDFDDFLGGDSAGPPPPGPAR